MSEEVDMTTVEVGGEVLGWVNGLGQRKHGQRCQGRHSCWRSVGVRDGGGRQQQGRRGMEGANSSKGVRVCCGWYQGRQRNAFFCGSPGVWDGRRVGDGKPLVLFFLDSMSGGIRVGSAIKWWLAAARVSALGGNNVGVSWEVGVGISSSYYRQRGRRRQGWQRVKAPASGTASARASTSGTAKAALLYTVGSIEGVGGVWSAAVRELAASGATAAMLRADCDGRRLAAVRAAALGMATARVTEAGESE